VRAPLLTRAARPATVEVCAIDEHGRTQPTAIAGEHPLTVYLDRREIVTLMTLGAAPEELAIGYLRNQGLVERLDDLAAVQVDWDVSAVAVTSRSLAERGEPLWGHDDGPGGLARRLGRRTVTTGCGQGTVFGDLMDALAPLPPDAGARLSPAVLQAVLEQVRRHESIYKVAGAVHGCALCANTGAERGEILRFVEDVGRHNAVDAIAGWMWLHDVAGHDKIFYTTGRLTSEMVIKCAQIGVPFLVSRSGLTQMGHALALRLGLTMFGRCQGRHYLLFTGAHRFDAPPAPAPAP
jgi:FdhD protein